MVELEPKPKSEEDIAKLVYYTQRSLDERGKVTAWVYRQCCPRCGKALMGKPMAKGKVKVRARDYLCPACGYAEEAKSYESKLLVNIDYACQNCGHEGAARVPFVRKRIKGVPAIAFSCESCGAQLLITKLKAKEK